MYFGIKRKNAELQLNASTVNGSTQACSSVFPGLSGAWTARLPRGVKRCTDSEPFLPRCMRVPLPAKERSSGNRTQVGGG